MADEFRTTFTDGLVANGAGPHYTPVEVSLEGESFPLQTGSVAIAAITSCTNTSNPSVMVGAGLLAKKAVERGLTTPPWVKTSLAPGSRAVTGYLDRAGLTPFLNELRFDLVGYGCTTCIGNSGPLAGPIEQAIEQNGLVAAAVLSGNRNFEGRIHPHIRASYLASPPLVVAYALAGRVDIDLTTEPLGEGSRRRAGVPLRHLADLRGDRRADRAPRWTGRSSRTATRPCSRATSAGARCRCPRATPTPGTRSRPTSSSRRSSRGSRPSPPPVTDITGARALAVLGDSITTDHISPAGSIPASSPAGRYLVEHGVEPRDFNSFGSRRGNHEVMMRGTFGNIRLRNALAGGKEGNWTEYLPTGEITSIYEASMAYQAAGTPLVVLAGALYGNGSSRDWAAKGTLLLGVRAVIAKSFERIHRGNLVGMGVLPLQFREGEGVDELGLTGRETFDIRLAGLVPREELTVGFTREDGTTGSFQALARIDGPTELRYMENGGILPTVLRRLYRESAVLNQPKRPVM